jgi:tape measure domain-containing protein
VDVGVLAATIALNMQPFMAAISRVQATVGRLGASLSGALGPNAQNSINSTRNSVNNLTSSFKDLDRMVSGILISQIFYAGVNAIEDGITNVVHFSSEMEKAGIAMEYFVGNAERAQGFILNMQDFAADTAFSTEQALQLSRRLMGAQVKPEQIRSVMTILNDANAATGATAQQMDRIVLALTQMKTNGKIAGQELRQLAEAGIPIYSIIRKELGLTQDQMRNIGKLGISGDTGVQAVLKGLQDQYKGAADRIADTLGGMWDTIKDDTLFISEKLFEPPMNSLRKFLRGWRDTIDKARENMNTKGLGGAFEGIIPEKALQQTIRNIIASFRDLAKAGQIVWGALGPGFRQLGRMIVDGLGVILPIIASIATAFAKLAAGAMEAWPWLKVLTAAIAGLIVAQVAAKALMFLWSITRLGAVCSAVATAVSTLGKAIQGLMLILTRNPIVAIIMVIVAALLYLITTSKAASAWIDKVMAKMSSLGSLFGGVDTSGVLPVEDLTEGAKAADEFNDMVEGLNDTLKETGTNITKDGDAAKAAAKKIKDKFVASFDELYQIPEQLDDVKDGLDDIGNGPGMDLDLGLDDIKTPAVPKPTEVPKADFSHFWDDWKIPPFIANMKNWFKDFEWPKLPPPPNFAVITFPLETVNSLLAKLKLSFQGLGDTIVDALGDFATDLGKFMLPAIPIIESVGAAVAAFLASLGLFPSDGINPIKEWATNFGKAFEEALNATQTAIDTWAINVAASFATFAKDALDALTQGFTVPGVVSVGTFVTAAAAAFATWFKDVNTGFTTWAKDVKTTVNTWSTDIKSIITTWAADTKAKFTTWSTDVVSAMTTWRLNTQTQFTTWATNAGAGFSTWSTAVQVTFGAWATAVAAAIATWSTNTKTAFNTWSTNVQTAFSTWKTNTTANFTIWSEAVQKVMTGMADKTKATLTTWVNATSLAVKDWGTNVGTNFATWGNAVIATFATVSNMAGATWTTFLNSTSLSTATWANGVSVMFSQLGNSIQDITNGWAGASWATTQGYYQGIATATATWASGMLTSLADWASKAWTAIKNVAKATGEAISGTMDSVNTHVANGYASAKAWAGDHKTLLTGIAIGAVVVGGVALAASTGGLASPVLLGALALERGGVVDQEQFIKVGEKNRREAVIPMENEGFMRPFSAAVANDLADMLQPQVVASSGGSGAGSTINLNVGVLVADDRGLKELHRQLERVGISENARKGIS